MNIPEDENDLPDDDCTSDMTELLQVADAKSCHNNNHDDESENFSLKVPPKFSFRLSVDEWADCGIHVDRRGDRHLGGKWTDIFSKKIAEKNPYCPLTFKRNHVIREHTRKQRTKFFNGRARCLFPGCMEYDLKITKGPNPERKIKVKVISQDLKDCISHTPGVFKGRPIKGQHRKETAMEIFEAGPSNVFYDRLGKLPPGVHEAGNKSLCGSKGVLQKYPLILMSWIVCMMM